MVLLDAAFPDEVDLERYSPGVLKKVESDHDMEAAVPDRIVEELEGSSPSPGGGVRR